MAITGTTWTVFKQKNTGKVVKLADTSNELVLQAMFEASYEDPNCEAVWSIVNCPKHGASQGTECNKCGDYIPSELDLFMEDYLEPE